MTDETDDEPVECDPALPIGRPRREMVQVCLRLPVQHYDYLYAVAKRNRLSIPEVIRQGLRRNMRLPSLTSQYQR